MNWWNPELWDKVGVVGLVLATGIFFVMSLMREWLVIGRYYRAVIADRDAEIAELRKARDADGVTINTLVRALAEKNATEDATTRLLTAVRDAAASRP
ncbi:uncharacterized protein RMCFA_5438 [Mycolicibacterium fortuitum subsp. acetamidolyticum]|uniref:Uncharacterized protein n=1 Tax=Mycolicibacterium fortuitum subsp. acetamidolyticum TaxID=144550 RepID=A0A100WVU6_MYCFO|nr:hypothetical protein [Mycolicibacterium fortuitum]MCV7137641.1 hypothetical protein [Mycolicibacterium fortuitum]GAT05327.1 uncharacterized protein RMCFA_5438 [Mycolicibacterium fortuitum subsp. acetamidolyticum]